MASLAQRVALVRQSEIHVQLATAQETADGDASQAVHHYLAAMELLGCATDGLFCIGPESGPVSITPQFAAPQAEVFFQVAVSKKVAAYRERVDLLMSVLEESTPSNDEILSSENADAPAESPPPEEVPSTVVASTAAGEEMFDDLYRKFIDAVEGDK